MKPVPELRLRVLNGRGVDPSGRYVLYWMLAYRRVRSNFALQRAVELAGELERPLLVLEELRCDYRWANDRLHRFVLEGMADNRDALRRAPAAYYPRVETEPGADEELVAALADQACVVVSDDYPTGGVPRLQRAAAARSSVRVEVVDSNGILPLLATGRLFHRASSFRRYVQENAPEHLAELPLRTPLSRVRLAPPRGLPPPPVARRWRPATEALLAARPRALARLPIDHGVPPGAPRGGARAGRRRLRGFLSRAIDRYAEDGRHPDRNATSGLSPYLHFGHVGAHEVLQEVLRHQGSSPEAARGRPTGRHGWWGLRAGAEPFLDQLVTWRELGFNLCSLTDDYDRYGSLPDWARRTLGKHARDRREPLYSFETLEDAATHDAIWNAAQTELRREGALHNYLRMLWGKKIIEWTRSPDEALESMIELNNKYALDGRDPNSYSGITWCLGRYDRPWGPERPIFGTVRYMSSENTRRKLDLDDYLRRHTP